MSNLSLYTPRENVRHGRWMQLYCFEAFALLAQDCMSHADQAVEREIKLHHHAITYLSTYYLPQKRQDSQSIRKFVLHNFTKKVQGNVQVIVARLRRKTTCFSLVPALPACLPDKYDDDIAEILTHDLYLMEGYSPRVEQSVASCSAIASNSALFLLAISGLYMLPKAAGRSREYTCGNNNTLGSQLF